MTTSSSLRHRYRRLRRTAGWAQAAAVLGLPFLRVGGESALRFDVPSLRLHVFGASLAMDELFLVLAATLLVTFAFLFATVILGRAWCGWACPQTVLGDLTAALERARRRGGPRAALAYALLAALAALVGANLVWYCVEPRAFLAGLAAGTLHPVAAGSWAILGLVVFLDLAFLRARFCATACPYARMQGALFDRYSLIVAYDRGREADCVGCSACVRVCPTGIDIRDGLQTECIACAECIDACAPIMQQLGRRPDLVAYAFGGPEPRPGAEDRGSRWRGALRRPAALALGLLTAASLALFVGLALARAPLELEVQVAPDFAPRRSADGRLVNALLVTLQNNGRGGLDVALGLRAEAGRAEVHLRPSGVHLEAGERRTLRVLAVADGAFAAAGPGAPGAVEGELTARVERGALAVARPIGLPLPRSAGTAREEKVR